MSRRGTKKARREGLQARRTLAALNGTIGAYRWSCKAGGGQSPTTYRTPEEAAKGARLHAAKCAHHVIVAGFPGEKQPNENRPPKAVYDVPMRGPIKLRENVRP
jgi:hypothetical protein